MTQETAADKTVIHLRLYRAQPSLFSSESTWYHPIAEMRKDRALSITIMDDSNRTTFRPAFALESERLGGYEEIRHGFSTRLMGNMSLKRGDANEAHLHRCQLVTELAADVLNVVTMRTEHGTRVCAVDTLIDTTCPTHLEVPYVMPSDGLSTNRLGIALLTTCADCLPVFLYDPVLHAIGLVHAGWKGVIDKVLVEAISQMRRDYGSKADNIVVWIGPSIHACCFEVQEDVWQAFATQTYASTALIERAGKRYVDLQASAAAQLSQSGVSGRNIEISAACTACDDRLWFSHRRDGSHRGAMAAMITLSHERRPNTTSSAA